MSDTIPQSSQDGDELDKLLYWVEYPRREEIKVTFMAYAERLATKRELDTVRYWHKQTIKEAPHPSDISNTLHAQEKRIKELEAALTATLTKGETE